MRTIDADGFKEKLYSMAFGDELVKLDEFIDHLDDQPTIEVKIVVHGEWLQCNNETHKRCSNCDIIAFIGLYPFGDAHYCPNCGCKMSKESD